MGTVTLNKRGETLIEVMVAMSILTIVFSSTVTLIFFGVKLAVISRNRTEAISYAEKGLATAISSLSSSCNLPDITEDNRTIENWNCSNAAVSRNCRVEVKPASNYSEVDLQGEDKAKYLLITSEVKWNDPLSGQQTYQLKELIRK